MKAAVLAAGGVPAIVEVERPVPGPTEILVEVRAASLNRADLLMLDGRAHGAHGGAGTRLGLEWAGDVVAVGAEVTAFAVGEPVMCSGIGGFAEFAVTDERRALPLPGPGPGPTPDHEAGACLTIALRTAHLALATLGGLAAGRSVLVLGAASAVGLACLQVARSLGAGPIVGTSTRAERRARLAAFGADLALDTGDARWPDQVIAATGGRGVDLVVDFLAGPFVADAMRATALGGTVVNVGRLAGETGRFDFDLHSLRRIRYLGTTFRTRTNDEIAAIGARMRADLFPAIADGRIALPIDLRLPLDRLAEAFDAMRRDTHFGKIVLTPFEP